MKHSYKAMLLAASALAFAAPAFAAGTAICTENGNCSLYAYLEDGEDYLLSESDNLGAHEDMAHFQVLNGRWRAWAATAPAGTGERELVFDDQWGPPSGGVPFAGDWNGDGYDEFGVAVEGLGQGGRNVTRFVKASIQTTPDGISILSTMPGFCDIHVVGGQPMVGDWDGDGIDSFGVYKDGVFTLVNDCAEDQPIVLNFSALLSTVGPGPVHATTWPWRDNGVDYVAMYSTTGILATSFQAANFIYNRKSPVLMMMHSSELGLDDSVLRPIVLPGDVSEASIVGAVIAPLDFCFDTGDGVCELINPESNGGAVRPGNNQVWFP